MRQTFYIYIIKINLTISIDKTFIHKLLQSENSTVHPTLYIGNLSR